MAARRRAEGSGKDESHDAGDRAERPRSDFATAMEALGNVVPQDSDGRQRVTRQRAAAVPAQREPTFHFPDPDQPRLAHRPGVRRRELRQLQSGRFPPERRIDLHGLRLAEARARLRDALGAASRAGERCVLVIHGKGRGSAEGESAIRRALSDWLVAPPVASWVRAFAPAQPSDGGAGATCVLLEGGGASDG